eukprot:GFKZ01005688.1.p1 GENE.GFKZ01005688.1~~GFKZ01005688.1.p1  ORF type:complete len:303 (+),score=63.34 GFKZ01005688.1:188-1096(+)
MSTPIHTAFLSTPYISFTSASPFHTAISGAPTRLPSVRHRGTSRARIVALGAAPPPPPKEPEGEEGEAADKTETPGQDTESVEEVTADDILSSPAFLKKKLEIVQKELIEAKAQLENDTEAVKAEKDKYVRLAADYENYRRRSMEDLRKQDAKTTAKVCKEILGVLDNFERAIQQVNAETDREKSISSSYQAINKQLVEAITKLKVEPIDAVGEVFDPELHEAIQKMESTEYAEDVVCAQFQRGYKIGDTLIRAAIVGVSEGPGPEVADDGEDGNGAVEIDDPVPEEVAQAVKEGEVEAKGQ